MKFLIVANWKMNLSYQKSLMLLKQYCRLKVKNLEIVVTPSYPILPEAGKILKRHKFIALGAQNAAWQESGALTGEVSPVMLRELGCRYVILGHSERKQYFHEDLTEVNRKVKAALASDLTPIICIGENWNERREGKTNIVLERQLEEVLKDVELTSGQELIICYEPFWTISTSGGRIATSDEVEHSARVINQVLVNLFGSRRSHDHFRIIYGGTVNAATVNNFLQFGTISGFLVGSASLAPDTFQDLLNTIK